MKRAAAAAAFLLLFGSFAPVQAATLRSIDQDGLNLRSGPGTDYAVVGGLAADQTATVLKKEGDWYQIRLASGTEGWVAGWYSRVLLTDEQRFAVVATDVLNVRRVPALSATVLAQLVQDQQVRLLEMIPEWWRVRLDNGTEGWVSARYMKEAPTGSTPPVTPPPVTPAPVTPTPVTPAPGTVAITPPPAPLGTVPDLGILPPQLVTALPGKTVKAKLETGIYAGPDPGSSRVATVRPTDPLRLLETAGGWVRTETTLGKRGWVHGSLVSILDGRLTLSLGEWAWALEALAAAPAMAPAPAPVTADTAFVTVKDPEGLNLRLVPSVLARVLATLPQGEKLEVLQKEGVWLRVKTAAGLTGWVHGDYTLPYGDPVPAPAPTQTVTGDGFKVSMAQPFAGASRLVVQATGKTIGQPVLQDGTLLIPFETGEPEERMIPLNLLGVKQAYVTPQGLRLQLAGQPSFKVEEAVSGRLTLLLRPVVRGITVDSVDGKAVYRFSLGGDTKPVAREAGENIIIEIPGAVLAAPMEIPGLRVVEHETGVRVAIPTYRTFSVKRSDQGFYVVVYPPGLAGKAILLDPGHGGDDVGAVNLALGVVEKQINLQVALRVRALLEAKGAKVFMTRATDRRVAPEFFLSSLPGEPRDQMDMLYRTTMANQLKSDLFLSIHHNSGNSGLRGTETFYTSSTLNGERSRLAARLIQEELLAALGTVNRGYKDDTYFVTRNTDAPAVLAELAFIQDMTEGLRTKDPFFQDAAAKAIVRALERLYAERPH